MNFQLPALRALRWPERVRGMFNLNDPRWGRGDESKPDAGGRSIAAKAVDALQAIPERKRVLVKNNVDPLTDAIFP